MTAAPPVGRRPADLHPSGATAAPSQPRGSNGTSRAATSRRSRQTGCSPRCTGLPSGGGRLFGGRPDHRRGDDRRRRRGTPVNKPRAIGRTLGSARARPPGHPGLDGCRARRVPDVWVARATGRRGRQLFSIRYRLFLTGSLKMKGRDRRTALIGSRAARCGSLAAQMRGGVASRRKSRERRGQRE